MAGCWVAVSDGLLGEKIVAGDVVDVAGRAGSDKLKNWIVEGSQELAGGLGPLLEKTGRYWLSDNGCC